MNWCGFFIFSEPNWYGFLIACGMAFCWLICYYNIKKRGHNIDVVFEIGIVALPFAVIGARFYYVFFDNIANPGSWTFWDYFNIFKKIRGLAIYGGLIGGMLAILVYSLFSSRRKNDKHISTFQCFDMVASVVLLGQAIGRWGNFINHEAFGNVVLNPSLQWFPYAIYVCKDGIWQWRQATFFYESMWDLLGFCITLYCYMGKRKSFDGFVLCVYCLFYGFGRFFIEGLRDDSLWLIPNKIRVSQLVSLIIFIFAAVFIITHIILAKKRGKKPFILVPYKDLNENYYQYEKSALSPMYKEKYKPLPIKKSFTKPKS